LKLNPKYLGLGWMNWTNKHSLSLSHITQHCRSISLTFKILHTLVFHHHRFLPSLLFSVKIIKWWNVVKKTWLDWYFHGHFKIYSTIIFLQTGFLSFFTLLPFLIYSYYFYFHPSKFHLVNFIHQCLCPFSITIMWLFN
jgi:hypothetical protein